MALLPGVFEAKKKDGTLYYRSSITFHSRHISLGSYPTEREAHLAYEEAKALLKGRKELTPDEYCQDPPSALSFQKWISLINFKNNGLYIKTPIYMRNNFFSYHLSPTDSLLFDADDLFYYSNHSIMRRGGHLFVAEYGMHTNIHSRYGIRNFARLGIDYRFVNGDTNDFRYSNIEIFNSYQGVTYTKKGSKKSYCTRIHIRGEYVVGWYDTADEAAIAYNKAVDTLWERGMSRKFEKNFLEHFSAQEYREIYDTISISDKILNWNQQSLEASPS